MKRLPSKTNSRCRLALTFLLLATSCINLNAANNWTPASSGLWRTAANWSNNAPPDDKSNNNPTQITNAVNKTVTIDAATAAANLVTRALTISAPAGSTNSLALVNVSAGPLAPKAFLVGSRSALLITNSAVNATDTFDISNAVVVLNSGSISCAVNCDLQSGSLLINSGTLDVGALTTGIRMGRFFGANASLTVRGGNVNTPRITLGSVAGSQNSLTINGGNIVCSDSFSAAQLPTTTGNVTMTAGSLTVTNGTSKIADRATATFDQSGGNVHFADFSIGDLGFGIYNLSGGTFTATPRTTNDLAIIGNLENGDFNQSGGVVVIGNELHIADFAGVVGNLNLTGGQFFATNDTVAIGREGSGYMIVSNAVAVLTNTSVGRHLGSFGSLTVQSNGSVFLRADLSIGRLSGAAGQVLVQGGTLSLTNDEIWVGRAGAGEMTVTDGSVRAKNLHVGHSEDGVNAPSGTVNISGGTLTLSSAYFLGSSGLSSGTFVQTGGALFITNNSATADLILADGSFTLSQGELTADLLFLTNTTATFTFNNGTLRSKGMTVANGLPFTVGDGLNPAVLELQGGTYTFADGLVISPNATVTGCGTVIGLITNNGTYNNPCSAAPPTTPTISNLGLAAGTASLSCISQTGYSYTLEYKNALGDPAWTPILPALTGNGGVLNLADPNATNATRFYRVRVQ